MLRQTLEKLPVGAYVCDSDGLITYFNEASVKLWGREPKLNAPTDLYCGSFKLFTTDGNPIRHDECCMALALQQRKAFNGQEFLIERPDGSRWLTLAHANPLFNVRGEPIVCTPEDAYRCFMRTEMDWLVLGNHILEKSAQPSLTELSETWQEEFPLD